MVVPCDDQVASAQRDQILESYYIFEDSGVEMVLASPEGGPSIVTARGIDSITSSTVARRFKQDTKAGEAFADTVQLDQAFVPDFDAIFFPLGVNDSVPMALAGLVANATAVGPSGYAYLVRNRSMLKRQRPGSAAEAAKALVDELS